MLFCDLPCHDVAAHGGALSCAGVVNFLGEYIREDLKKIPLFIETGLTIILLSPAAALMKY
jgi:hypothetical protein